MNPWQKSVVGSLWTVECVKTFIVGGEENVGAVCLVVFVDLCIYLFSDLFLIMCIYVSYVGVCM